jgi:hypothetical protein
MIPELRQRFNAEFTPEKYRRLLDGLHAACGAPVKFRVSETPCFFPAPLLERMALHGRELVSQLLANPAYMAASDESIPPEFNVPRQPAHPMFVCVDFGLVRGASGGLEPRLVELQGFPSLYAFQPALASQYRQAYGLEPGLRFTLGGLDEDSYPALLRRAILGGHDPEHVILMEIDPQDQKTLPDFLLTGRLCGIRTVCITAVRREGKRLYYQRDGKRVPIRRIYNRAIVDELVRKNVKLDVDFRDDLEVEWAGHPNWYFRLSKYSTPFLAHPCVPRTWFLDQLERLPDDLENYLLKPLYSFAGLGIRIAPSREELEAIPPGKRHDYILQERMRFEPVIHTPAGPTQAEVRVMYIWLEEMTPVQTIIRTGRGLMMGVDHNRNLEWVGASAGFYLPGDAGSGP